MTGFGKMKKEKNFGEIGEIIKKNNSIMLKWLEMETTIINTSPSELKK